MEGRTKLPAPGPELETYLETRLNLLTTSVDKLEEALRERIDAVENSSRFSREALKSEIEHAKNLLATAQETANRSTDKAEKTQHDINIASNEWRGTLNDFKTTVPSKSEFDRFYGEFSAYRLENAKMLSVQIGEKAGKTESKDDWKSLAALVIAIAAAAVAYFSKN